MTRSNLEKEFIWLIFSFHSPILVKVRARTSGRSLRTGASGLLLYGCISHLAQAHLPTDNTSHDGLVLLHQLTIKKRSYRHV